MERTVKSYLFYILRKILFHKRFLSYLLLLTFHLKSGSLFFGGASQQVVSQGSYSETLFPFSHKEDNKKRKAPGSTTYVYTITLPHLLTVNISCLPWSDPIQELVLIKFLQV